MPPRPPKIPECCDKYIVGISLGSSDSVSSEALIEETIQDINARLHTILDDLKAKRKDNTLNDDDLAKVTKLYNDIRAMRNTIKQYLIRDTKQTTL